MTQPNDPGMVLTGLFGLDGKVALVTGAASGLGYAFASILADAGSHVVVADVDQFGAEKVAGQLGSASPALLDVSDRAAVDTLTDQIVAEHGHLDIVFANAGVARGTPPLVSSGVGEDRSEEHTSELQSHLNLVCRLLLE